MLKHEFTQRRPRGLATASLLAGVLLIPAGATLAVDGSAARTEDDAAHSTMTLEELRSMVADLSQANEELREDNATLQQSVDALAAERDRLAQSIERFDDLYGPLESDRQLLLDLRKQLPETRPEAEQQLARIRSLALKSDPQRLGQLIDRVEAAAPAFLDWRFGEYDSSQEFSAAYTDTGANAFDANFDEFRSGVLMSVANRLDGLLTILDRVR